MKMGNLKEKLEIKKKSKKGNIKLFQKGFMKMGNLKEKLEIKKKSKKGNTKLFQKEVMSKKEEKGNDDIKPIGKKKRKREKESNVDASKAVQTTKDKPVKAEGKKNKNKPRKKKRKGGEKNNALIGKSDQLCTETEEGFEEQNDNEAADQSLFKTQGDTENTKGQSEDDIGGDIRTRKSKKSKKKKKERHSLKEGEIIPERIEEAVQDEVYYISSGEEDCSNGMKKWLTEYHQSRPGLKVLQQRIDQFITAHEEKLEQERKEREARAAEDGWTVVVHHKGRKKTTDSESGITVGSVAPAVAENQMAKKKNKEVGPNFYRFQKREAQRNEILALQSKFEQDRKRIQQLRAARKFRPY